MANFMSVAYVHKRCHYSYNNFVSCTNGMHITKYKYISLATVILYQDLSPCTYLDICLYQSTSEAELVGRVHSYKVRTTPHPQSSHRSVIDKTYPTDYHM